MSDIIRECKELMEGLKDIPFDKALPKLQTGLWEIAQKHNTTGPEVFSQYMEWKSSSE